MELESTRIFIKVVELGSFSRAADLLKLPKSTVSRTISRLESETGTKLLLRTTRSLKMTAAGLAFYESCAGAVRQLEEARRSLHGADSIVAGTVKLTAPEDLGNYVIAPATGQLIKQHPGLSFDLNFTDEIVDLVQGGYDLAIRLGKLKSSSFKVRKLGEVTLVPVASPAYLRKTKIQEPKDLSGAHCLTYRGSATNTHWILRSKKGTINVPITPRASGNQMTSLVHLAVQGAGVALVPDYLCSDELRSGKLERVLPDWSGLTYQASLVSPQGISSSARLKVVSDHLVESIRKTLSLSNISQ